MDSEFRVALRELAVEDRRKRSKMRTYEVDFAGWAQDTARAICDGRWLEIDRAALADEASLRMAAAPKAYIPTLTAGAVAREEESAWQRSID